MQASVCVQEKNNKVCNIHNTGINIHYEDEVKVIHPCNGFITIIIIYYYYDYLVLVRCFQNGLSVKLESDHTGSWFQHHTVAIVAILSRIVWTR